MITGAIKNKVDKIWTDIWAGGITNPLTVIEQLTYLMFIRSLDEKELETEEFENMTGGKMDKIFPPTPLGQSMRWSKFKHDDSRDIYEIISKRVFPAIKNMRHGCLPDINEKGEPVWPDAPPGILRPSRMTPGEYRLCPLHERRHVPDSHAPGAAKDHYRAG